MLSYNPKSWRSLIFSKVSRSILKKMSAALVTIVCFTFLICYSAANYINLSKVESLRSINYLYNILGFVISLLLAFRTNSAYDRWWEGRKQLGSLTNTTRSLAIKIISIIDEASMRKYLITILSSFLVALKNHLRNETDYSTVTDINMKLQKNMHLPIHILYRINENFENLKKEKKKFPQDHTLQ